jgi:chromosome segregation ATPase
MDTKALDKSLEALKSSHQTEIRNLQREYESLQAIAADEEETWKEETAKLTTRRNHLNTKLNTVKKKLNDTKTEAKVHYNNCQQLKAKISGREIEKPKPPKRKSLENDSCPTVETSTQKRRKINESTTPTSALSQHTFTPMTFIDVELDSSQVTENDYDSDGSTDLSQPTTFTATSTKTTLTTGEFSVDLGRIK